MFSMQQHRFPLAARLATAAAALLFAGSAHASLFKGEALDTAANVIAIVVLVFVPVVLVVGFWLVHIIPEKVAEERHHPQKDAIKVLCLLSLVFGGMLWPLAWIFAYTKPTLYKMAYGRDKHDDYYKELAEQDPANAGELSEDLGRLRAEIDSLASRGKLPEELGDLRERLIALQSQVVTPAGRAQGPEGAG